MGGSYRTIAAIYIWIITGNFRPTRDIPPINKLTQGIASTAIVFTVVKPT
jgi:hypothetical protein